MESRNFGRTKAGQQVMLYTLRNERGLILEVSSLGATIVSLKIPDRDGVIRDVVLGYDNVKDYEEKTYYFGAVIGRNANRIRDAKCNIAGYTYRLDQNDNENNLHSGNHGFHSAVWIPAYKENQTNKITFTYFSAEGEQGFPGNMTAQVTYSLTEQNELVIAYEAKTDKTTIANFTNHAYYNLSGHDSGNIEHQELEILASYYTPVIDAKAIPTGEIAKVIGTPMDFRVAKEIGQDINEPYEQLAFASGYDHNYVLDKANGTLQLAARAKSKVTGITMNVFTDCVGMQFYSGNFIENHIGKSGVNYGNRQGFCLETQYFPNAMNDVNFESPILEAGQDYHTKTVMSFSAVK